MSNLIDHAKREFLAAGYKPVEEEQDGPNKWIQQNVLALLELFSSQGHSGFSAPFCIQMFTKLANFEPLCPLTGEDSEWSDVAEEDGKRLFQNKRCSHVFKRDGVAYDSEGVVFYDWMTDSNGNPYKSYFTCKESRVNITFPYAPVKEYCERIETKEEKA